MAGGPPRIGRRTVEALLEGHWSALRERRLVLVHGHYPQNELVEFTARIGGTTRRVHVTEEDSVLGILTAWQDHQRQPGRDVLVVATAVDDDQLGWDLRGHAVKRRTLTVEAAEIVKQRFGTGRLDTRLYRETWLLDALLDAEPADGWPRIGSLLTRDTALRLLLTARLGFGSTPGQGRGEGGPTTPDTAIDMDTLLAWTGNPTGLRRFAELPPQERTELKKWLAENAGTAAPVLMSLVEADRGEDAMALGLLGAVLDAPEADPDVALSVGGLFGQVMPRRADLRHFTEAVEGTLTRWIGQAQNREETRRRVETVLQRADALAEKAGLTPSLRSSRFLRAGFTAQLRRVTDAAARQATAEAESALADLAGHALASLLPDRVATAEMAVRVARWLAQPHPTVASVPIGVRHHLAEWGWVDRALTVLWAGDPGADPVIGQDLHTLYRAARARRAALDGEFAQRLAGWTVAATAAHPAGCLVVENVLTEAVRPLLRNGSPAPLVLVVDGMSSAVAAQLGEDFEREGWIETVPRPTAGDAPARIAAVSMLPSVTEISRASLLTASAVKGGQSVEAAGFAAFWARHRRSAVLFHKAAIGGADGRFLAEELSVALASEHVVGVVLNTVDDALDKGQQGRRTAWTLDDITYLRELLAAASSYGRPVAVVADHGHVLERGEAPGAAGAEGAESARWRTGTPAEGEVLLTGPRVFEGSGSVVAAWREDIRHTARRAGYHGGAALAEVTVPLLLLVPSRDAVPANWVVLPRERAMPDWWSSPRSEQVRLDAEPVGGPLPPTLETGARETEAGSGDLPAGAGSADSASPPSADTLGGRVVASEVYQAQKEYVRKAPETKVVTAVIDALADAGGKMSPAALIAAVSATGRIRSRVDGFVAVLQRLLNVEGYPVLGFVDGGHTVKLDVRLLTEQFRLKEQQ
ncbi:BREX-2 system phosphatase PglZ [Kitasatospora sp. RB6PN24]|uniref:BREX-2 system phosphatase PglZ n=1 Tax=Kitasatospora humi TaxID=2893891 RepID=UPI001E384955|nr:BREX-2 system phosphatase PglZ [Kitasatospora humi]MCC9307571.1 BREX-2 system phosphatase PglZ [Kitasatospora humi]